MELIEHVGRRIRELRESFNNGQGLSQDKLATQLRIAPNTVSRWETGTYKPSLEDLDQLARFFGVSVLEFFPREQPKADEKIAALLRTAAELEPDDIDELRRYAEFRKARHIYEGGSRARPGRKQGKASEPQRVLRPDEAAGT